MQKIIMLAISLAFISCATQTKTSDQTMKMQKVKSKIKKGLTTKAQVIETFGSPEMVNAGSDGKEQWVYSKHYDQSNWDRKGASASIFDYFSSRYTGINFNVNSSKSKYTSQSNTTTLSIYFNRKGIVDRYYYGSQKS